MRLKLDKLFRPLSLSHLSSLFPVSTIWLLTTVKQHPDARKLIINHVLNEDEEPLFLINILLQIVTSCESGAQPHGPCTVHRAANGARRAGAFAPAISCSMCQNSVELADNLNVLNHLITSY